MAIRCSIFGCQYDGSEIEREERRRGDEVVLTVREYEECVHCGDVRVISENTGVTAVTPGTRDGEVEEGAASVDPGTGSDPDPGPGSRAETPDRGAVITEAEPGGDDARGEAVTDDAVLLEDDEGSGADPADHEGGGDPVDEEATADRPPGTTADPPDETPPDADTVDPGPETTGGESPTPGGEPTDPGSHGKPEPVEERPSLAEALRDAEGEVTDATDEPDDDGVILDDDSDDARRPARSGGSDAAQVTDREWPTFDDHRVEAPDAPGPAEAAATDPSAGSDAPADDAPADDAPLSGPPGGDWPTHGGEDEGYAARADADGPEVEFAGLTPESAPDPGEGVETVGAPDRPADAGDATGTDGGRVPGTDRWDGGDGRATPREGGPRTTDDWTTAGDAGNAPELHCPGCGASWVRAETAHRAGDICPECGGGYLNERRPGGA